MMRTDKSLRVSLCQIDTAVGDIDGNCGKVIDFLDRARACGTQLALFPELSVSGYPPEDLLLKRHFVEECSEGVDRIAREAQGIVALVGYPEGGRSVYNSLALLAEGRKVGNYRKVLLPNYGVFDEKRYFTPGSCATVCDLGHVRLGLSVCEDIWSEEYPIAEAARAGAQVIANISSSPYHQGKGEERQEMLSARARKYGVYVLFCNSVGGQDELVFDGHSLAIDPEGRVLGCGKQFEEDIATCELELGGSDEAFAVDSADGEGEGGSNGNVTFLAPLELPEAKGDVPERNRLRPLADDEEVYQALVLGTRDYVRKNGFEHVVIGLSGGVDSSLVACIAADALGEKNVTGVVMPSPFSSKETQSDARALEESLKIDCLELPIADAMESYEEILSDVFKGTEPDVTEENIQARIRGNLLMALSNKFGWLVLATGNKSEYSVGYATLYGDMAGGFAVLKDVPKTLVYRLARYRNGVGDKPPVPVSILERPPSAELRPDQLDRDTLPPYEVLDPILEGYVEEDLSSEQLAERGFDERVVDSVIKLVDASEYKRRQAPPGVKIRPKAFGRDRRLPITSLYRG